MDIPTGWLLDMPRNDGVLRIETANEMGQHNGTVESLPGVLRVDHWQHVAVVVRRGENNTRLYVNGYEVGSGTVNSADFNNPHVNLHIGRIQNAQFLQVISMMYASIAGLSRLLNLKHCWSLAESLMLHPDGRKTKPHIDTRQETLCEFMAATRLCRRSSTRQAP